MSARTAASLARRIDDALPQHQCRRCGYDACGPYADAIARGEAINRCAPGGEAVIRVLAAMTGRPAIPLDPACGIHAPPSIARIDEAWCIGCVLCVEACPVDAIVGAPKRMHAVLPALCTGCELCVAPCPVDCIALIPAGRSWSPEDARAARNRFDARERRRAPTIATGSGVSTRADAVPRRDPAAEGGPGKKKAAIDAAFSRARARRATAATTRR